MIWDRSCRASARRHLHIEEQSGVVKEYLESGSDHCLAGNHGGQDGYHQAWVKHPWWSCVEEWIRVCLWMVTDEGCLANVL